MAKEEKKPAAAPVKGPSELKNNSGSGNASSQTQSEKCKFVECKSKSEKFGFCMEHYNLYMEGVIRGDGQKPSDYAEKLARFLSKNHNRKAA